MIESNSHHTGPKAIHSNPLLSAIKYSLASFLMIAICILYLGLGALDINRQMLNLYLANIVENIASFIDGDKHQQVLKEGKTGSSLYFDMLEPMVKIHNENPDIVYLYTMKDVGGHFIYGLDTSISPELKTNRVLVSDEVNAIYEAENYDEWSSAVKLGETYVFDDFIEDEYGVLMTATKAFYDSKGAYVGNVSVDVNVDYYHSNQQGMLVRIYISFVIALILSSILGYYIFLKQKSIQKLQHELYRSTIIDPLTQIYNRRHFEKEYQRTQSLLHTKKVNYCLAILDLDFFKSINDQYGHQSGDIVLEQVAEVIKSHLRPQDLVFRYGGEEFIILFSDSTLEKATRVATRLIEQIKKTEINLKMGKKIFITASVGVTQAQAYNDPIKVADKLLYKAKNSGRDQVVYG